MPFAKGGVWRAPRILTVAIPTNAAILTSPNVAAFIADAAYDVVSVAESHETLATDGGAVTLDIVKSTGTQTAAAGATMLTSTFSLKSTINTVVRKDVANGGLLSTVAGKARRRIAKGDRIALNFGGTLTALTGVCVTIILLPVGAQPSY